MGTENFKKLQKELWFSFFFTKYQSSLFQEVQREANVCEIHHCLVEGQPTKQTQLSRKKKKEYLYLEWKVVVKSMDNAIHLKNHYSLDSIVCFVHTHSSADTCSWLSGREHHSPFEHESGSWWIKLYSYHYRCNSSFSVTVNVFWGKTLNYLSGSVTFLLRHLNRYIWLLR